MKYIPAAVALAALASCVQVHPTASFGYDEFTRTTALFSNTINDVRFGASSPRYYFQATHFKDSPKTPVSVDLVVTWTIHGDWALLDSTRDSDGNRLATTVRDRHGYATGYGPTMYESLTVDIGRDYLEAHRESGMHLRFYGQRGVCELIVKPAFVAEFCDEMTRRFPEQH